MNQTIEQVTHTLAQQLIPAYGDHEVALHHAWELVEYATGLNRAQLLINNNLPLSAEQQQNLDLWAHQIVVENKPIQYILGDVPFLDLTIKVRPPILIPRPETEDWCAGLIEEIKKAPLMVFDTILSRASYLDTTPAAPLDMGGRSRDRLSGSTQEKSNKNLLSQTTAQPEYFSEHDAKKNVSKDPSEALKILDLCTGSGCIALALAKAFPTAQIIATDISPEALALAQENAQLNNINNVTFIQSDVYENIPHQKFDLIVANPPYIDPEEYVTLDPSVTAWEDKNALVAPEHGLAIIDRITEQAAQFLRPLPYPFAQLWIEIGYRQGDVVSNIFTKYGFTSKLLKDAAGNNRVVVGTLQ